MFGKLARNLKANQYGQSQNRLHSIILYCTTNYPSYNDGPEDFNYYYPYNDPIFVLYYSLVSIAYSGCDERKVEYNACQQEQNVLNTGIMAINNNLSRAFDTTYLCAICDKVGHNFKGCKEL